MDRAEAIQQLKTECNQASAGVTRMHPLVAALKDGPTESEVFRALFELTKQVETVKKHLMKLERRDDSELV